MRTEQQLPASGRCCCLQRPLVSMWNCTALSHLLLPWDLQTFISLLYVQLFLLSSPETCLVSALPSPGPGFSLFPWTDSCFMLLWCPLVTCGVLQPFIKGKKCILNNLYIACFVSPPVLALTKHRVLGAKFLFPDGLWVRLFRMATQEKDPSPSPHLFCGVCLSFTTLLMNGVLKAWAACKEFSRFNACLIHHQLNNWKYPFVPLCHPVR